MTTTLLLLLALALGLGAGVLLGRSQASGRGDQEIARDLDQARTELGQLHQALADARVATAHAQSEVAVATVQRDAAVSRAEEIEAGRQQMVEQFRLLSHEVAEQQRKSVDSAAQQRLQATEQMLAPVTATLKEFQSRLTDVEKERIQIATEMRTQVRTVRDAGEAMRREAATLVNALRKPQVRGSWGETTLKNVARLSGMVERCDFELQVTTRSDDGTQRPDMKVNLADGKHVFVDSKVPLSAFLDAAGSDDEQQKVHHLEQFARHVRKHVDDLSTKQYWKAAESPEFVVLFLPSEEFFSAALDQMPDLYEYAVKKDVVIATPTTLIGMLRAISYGWKQAALADKAAEVFKLGRELHERLGQMGAKFDKLGRALASSVNAYNETVGTVETRVMVSARRFRDLQVSESELAPIQQLEAPVRQAQAPELIERPVPSVAELVEADAEATLWGPDGLSQEA